jgi:hypothetical protein
LQKHTAGLTALTEKNLAERAGHLEMLAGGKKEQNKKGDEKKKWRFQPEMLGYWDLDLLLQSDVRR